VTRIKRKITAREQFQGSGTRKGCYTVHLTLECGHDQIKPLSEAPKGKYVFCKQCEHLRTNGKGNIYPARHIQEAWDETTQMPRFVSWYPNKR
jgi:hypothetical protein